MCVSGLVYRTGALCIFFDTIIEIITFRWSKFFNQFDFKAYVKVLSIALTISFVVVSDDLFRFTAVAAAHKRVIPLLILMEADDDDVDDVGE